MTVSVVMITNNNVDVVEEALQSVEGLWGELLVDDAGSTDGTREILRKYNATIITSGNKNLGQRKQGLVMRALGQWILILDADERVSKELRMEILRILNGSRIPATSLRVNKSGMTIAWRIPYQNYVFGKPVYAGGEQYAKVRLFRKGYGRIAEIPLHEEIIIEKFHKATPSKKLRGGLGNERIGELTGVIHHHSYRTPSQLFSKFTRYAWIAAGEKMKQKEALTFSRLFFYGPHMFWSRFVKEKGYRDGWRGFVLACAFAYMESLTYSFLIIKKL